MAGYGSAAANAEVQLSSGFRIEIDGIQIMAFEEYEFTPLEHSVIEHRTGIDPLINRTSSGITKKAQLTLTKHERVGGVADVNAMLNWALAASTDRRNGAVITLDRAGETIRRTNFSDGWVSQYTPPSGNANEADKIMTHKFVLEVMVASYS
jgi:phage tail-like protein